MEHVHLRAVWNDKTGRFNLKFQILGIEGSSPMFWEIDPPKFQDMVMLAERQLMALDGQNRVNRSIFHYEFIDKHGNDCEINFQNADRDTFRQVTEYLRKVWDGWREVYAKEAV